MRALAWMVSTAVAATPLRVRVLERERPERVEVESGGGKLSCDGQPLDLAAAPVEVHGGLLELGLSKAHCREVSVPGPIVVTRVKGRARRYRGALSLSIIEGELAVINRVDLEDYLRGVVGDEQLAGTPQALAAQAVVSRTYALASLGRHQAAGYDVCDLTHCQLYRGLEDERPVATGAVQATLGEVLRYDGALLPTYFHSSCGGATSSPADVFGEDSPATGVVDREGTGPPLCARAPSLEWSWEVPRAALAGALGVPAEHEAFHVVRRDVGGRVIQLESFGVRMSGESFHSRVGRAFGFQALKSLALSATELQGVVRFSGRGLGHGVGLCQYGARELARSGRDYRAILRHYFPGAALGSLP